MMKVNQRFTRNDFPCKEMEYENIGQLKKINMDYESCILKSFNKNWSQRNRSCSPSVLENYNTLYKKSSLYFIHILESFQDIRKVL